MKREALRAGMKVSYRWPPHVTHSGGPVADAEIVEADWRVPLDKTYRGQPVRVPAGTVGSRVILYRLPGHLPELRAAKDAAAFVNVGAADRHRRAEHFAREGIVLHPGGPPAVVALMAEGRGVTWEPATAALGIRGKLLVRLEDGTDLEGVDPRRLRGPGFLQSEDDRRRYAAAKKAEHDRRHALKTETAVRLGLDGDAVSLGSPNFDGSAYSHHVSHRDEVLLTITPGALAGLIDRALSDPGWAAQVQGEGVLDALAALGGF